MSRSRISSAGINTSKLTTDKEVMAAWSAYNKKEADWEKYCRSPKPKISSYVDFSALAYNGVAEDF